MHPRARHSGQSRPSQPGLRAGPGGRGRDAGHRHGVCGRRRPANGAGRAAALSTTGRPAGYWPRPPPAWPPCTGPAWCTATSTGKRSRPDNPGRAGGPRHRLRHRPRRWRPVVDPDRAAGGRGRIPGPRSGGGPPPDTGGRRLQPGCDALRDGQRPPPLRGRAARRHSAWPPRRRPGPPRTARPGGPPGAHAGQDPPPPDRRRGRRSCRLAGRRGRRPSSVFPGAPTVAAPAAPTPVSPTASPGPPAPHGGKTNVALPALRLEPAPEGPAPTRASRGTRTYRTAAGWPSSCRRRRRRHRTGPQPLAGPDRPHRERRRDVSRNPGGGRHGDGGLGRHFDHQLRPGPGHGPAGDPRPHQPPHRRGAADDHAVSNHRHPAGTALLLGHRRLPADRAPAFPRTPSTRSA